MRNLILSTIIAMFSLAASANTKTTLSNYAYDLHQSDRL